MATVRFSKELCENIIKAAKTKMQPAVDRAREQRPAPEWGMRIYNTLVGDLRPALDAIPAHWLKYTDKITIEECGSLRCNLEYKLPNPVAWPMEIKENDLYKKYSGWGDGITLKDSPVWSEYFNEVSQYVDRVRVAVERQKEFVSSVEQIITAHTTLAPALKMWPPLWDLLSEPVKDKHREIKHREKKETDVVVDFDKLTALSTAAKFGV
jgi:hypothetical protein